MRITYDADGLRRRIPNQPRQFILLRRCGELSQKLSLFFRRAFGNLDQLIVVAEQGGAGQLSRPAIDGRVLLYGIATPRGSRIVQRVMGTRKHRALVRSPRLLLFNPSANGRSFAYVRADARRSRLMVRKRHAHGAGRVLLSLARAKGSLWSNALTGSVAYATIVQPSSNDPRASIVGVSRRHPKRFRQRGPRGGGNHRF